MDITIKPDEHFVKEFASIMTDEQIKKFADRVDEVRGIKVPIGFIVNRDYEKARKEYLDTIANKHKVSSLTVKNIDGVYIFTVAYEKEA